MKSGTDQTRKAAQIVEVRALQQFAAQAKLHKASRVLKELQGDRALQVGRQDERLKAWSSSLAGAILRLDLMAAWASAITEGQDDLDRTDRDIVEAQSEFSRLKTSWQKSVAQTDAADGMQQLIARKAKRQEEELTSSNSADLVSQIWAAR